MITFIIFIGLEGPPDGDNLDKSINPCFMTSEHQRQSLHFFHSCAAFDQVNCGDLPCDAPSGDVKGLT